MTNIALEEWLFEDAMGGPDMGMAPQGDPNMGMGGPPQGDPNVANPAPQQMNPPPQPQQNSMPNVSNDPAAPDMPASIEEKDFEQWKNAYFKETTKGDVNTLIDLIHHVRDLDLDAYPRKFVEDNLQVCFLRQNANIDKACKEIRRLVRDELDKNNPSVSLVNHITNTLQTMPELNNIFIKLKGLLGAKGDLHRKFICALVGGVQVGSGGNTEDVVYNERDYSIRISTRYNDKWGMVDLGKWSLKEDDPDRYLTEPEQRRLEEGSPEEKDVLRRRIVLESISDTFKKKGFIINVVGDDGTIHTLAWDLSGSIKGAYSDGKLVVRTIQSENSDAMIDSEGTIISYVDIKIKYVKESGGVDEEGKPAKEELDFMERIDGMLFLTAQFRTIKEASSSFPGIVLKELPYSGSPSDLRVLQRCIPSAQEQLLRTC